MFSCVPCASCASNFAQKWHYKLFSCAYARHALRDPKKLILTYLLWKGVRAGCTRMTRMTATKLH
jgi:hypothetical protein